LCSLSERVPQPQRADRGGSQPASAGLEHLFREHRGDVLECAGHRELRLRRQHLAHAAEEPAQPPIDAGRLPVTVRGEQLVEHAVLAAVHRLLADEAGDLLAEHRVRDVRLVVLHRIDEEALALREQHRQRGEERRRVGIVVEPVAGDGGDVDTERDVAAWNRHDATVGRSGQNPCITSCRVVII
jgi:hypothetical protein